MEAVQAFILLFSRAAKNHGHCAIARRLIWTSEEVKTWMQRERIPKDVRNAVQNHSDGDMDELYGHYSFQAEKRDALERWAQYIRKIRIGVTEARADLAADRDEANADNIARLLDEVKQHSQPVKQDI
jgi:hypothetical protein